MVSSSQQTQEVRPIKKIRTFSKDLELAKQKDETHSRKEASASSHTLHVKPLKKGERTAADFLSQSSTPDPIPIPTPPKKQGLENKNPDTLVDKNVKLSASEKKVNETKKIPIPIPPKNNNELKPEAGNFHDPIKKESGKDTKKNISSKNNNLHKEVAQVASRPEKKSILSHNDDEIHIHGKNATEKGVIIKEKKQHSKGIGSSVKEAFGEWLGSAQEIYNEKTQTNEQEHYVSPAESRKEIIEKARQQSNFVPQKDYLKRGAEDNKNLTQIPKPPTKNSQGITKNKDLNPPSWEHVVEDKTQIVPKESEIKAIDRIQKFSSLVKETSPDHYDLNKTDNLKKDGLAEDLDQIINKGSVVKKTKESGLELKKNKVIDVNDQLYISPEKGGGYDSKEPSKETGAPANKNILDTPKVIEGTPNKTKPDKENILNIAKQWNKDVVDDEYESTEKKDSVQIKTLTSTDVTTQQKSNDRELSPINKTAYQEENGGRKENIETPQKGIIQQENRSPINNIPIPHKDEHDIKQSNEKDNKGFLTEDTGFVKTNEKTDSDQELDEKPVVGVGVELETYEPESLITKEEGSMEENDVPYTNQKRQSTEQKIKPLPKNIKRKEDTGSSAILKFVPYGMHTAVAIVAIVLGVMAGMIIFSTDETTPLSGFLSDPPDLFVNDNTVYVFAPDRIRLLDTLKNETETARVRTQFVPSLGGLNENRRLLSTNATMNLLKTTPNNSLTSSISEIALGASRDKDPFIVMAIKRYDHAFAGMLDWENSIRRDLSPWFGAVSIATKPTNQFIDGSVEGRNVRIKLNENEEEMIVYGFFNEHTLIITNSSESFSSLLPYIR